MSADIAVGVDLATGAFSRARFESELAKAVSEARRTHKPISVIYVDADDFQEHRDVHGEERSLELLSWLAQRLSLVVDGKGPVGRVDGDAFAVFLPGVALTEACALGEKLRVQVANTRQRGDAGSFRVTISAGVAALRRNEPWGNLLEAAESACRKAKQGGRDRMVRR
jgi:diguanylate cyclase (GGDEF)-like protein